MSTRSWILRLLAGLLLVLGALSLVNAVIDHSRLFGTPDIEGLNRWKPFFFGDQFISKPYTYADNQLHKVGSTIWGPIHSYFHESMRGKSIIRAFQQEESIMAKQN